MVQKTSLSFQVDPVGLNGVGDANINFRLQILTISMGLFNFTEDFQMRYQASLLLKGQQDCCRLKF